MKFQKKPTILSQLVSNTKIRFIAVGVINTSVDFAILFTLVGIFSFSAVVSNVISTSIALLVSFLLNKKAVFRDTDTTNFRQVALFISVTLAGLWVVQGSIIYILNPIMQSVFNTTLALFAAKMIASVFSLVWNYLWYSRVIFRHDTTAHKK